MTTSRRDLLLGRIRPAIPETTERDPVPLRAFLYGVDARPGRLSAEAPAEESRPPWMKEEDR